MACKRADWTLGIRRREIEAISEESSPLLTHHFLDLRQGRSVSGRRVEKMLEFVDAI